MRQCALVTGGSGFLGSFAVRDLLAAGFEDVVVKRVACFEARFRWS